MAAGRASPGRPHLIVQLRKSPENGEGRKLDERKVRERLMCHDPEAPTQPASSTDQVAKQIAMRREQAASPTEMRRPVRRRLNPGNKHVSPNNRVSRNNRVGTI
jgi:hypothetical protein